MAPQATVISLGGSAIAPKEGIDVEFIANLRDLLNTIDSKFVIVVGGGAVCRTYQKALRELGGSHEDEDWIGIHTTRLNAHLLRIAFGIQGDIVTNPEGPLPDGKFIFGAGWVPGHSTDYDTALLASRVQAKMIINISNVTHVYTDDPKSNPNAQKITNMTWTQLRQMVGAWKPGLNAPFDPIAAKYCDDNKLQVAIVGKNIDNLAKLLKNETFDGTLVQ